ncbi:MAG: hypothetical protein CFH21_00783, partial [Alphaproteobacteria bacterium MarineAlpha5_Bin11]
NENTMQTSEDVKNSRFFVAFLIDDIRIIDNFKL